MLTFSKIYFLDDDDDDDDDDNDDVDDDDDDNDDDNDDLVYLKYNVDLWLCVV